MFKKQLAQLLKHGVGAAIFTSLLIIPVSSFAGSPHDMATLLKGGVVVNDANNGGGSKGASQVEAKIIIPRPPEQILPVVTNPQKLMQEERKVKKIKTLSKSGNTQEVEYTVMMNSLLPTFNYILRLEQKQPNEVQFKRISGSFKDFEGCWKLIPLENGKKTLLTYTLSIDPGFFAPKFLVMQAIKSDLPSMMKNVKTAIDKQMSDK